MLKSLISRTCYYIRPVANHHSKWTLQAPSSVDLLQLLSLKGFEQAERTRTEFSGSGDASDLSKKVAKPTKACQRIALSIDECAPLEGVQRQGPSQLYLPLVHVRQ